MTRVAALSVLLCALAPVGCDRENRAPEETTQRLLKAVADGENEAVYRLLAPETREQLEALAKLASAQTGGRRKLAPVDLLVTGMDQVRTKREAVALTDVKVEGDRARVKLVEGHEQQVIELVRVDGRWRVVLPISTAPAK